MKLKLSLELQRKLTQEVQLICNCCGQPYYPGKAWEDRWEAVMSGQEKFAICPVCAQAPSKQVFESSEYRQRCTKEVYRLQVLHEKDLKERAKLRSHK
jgi:hypothetical protein